MRWHADDGWPIDAACLAKTEILKLASASADAWDPRLSHCVHNHGEGPCLEVPGTY